MVNRKRFDLKPSRYIGELVHKFCKSFAQIICANEEKDTDTPHVTTELYSKGIDKYKSELDVSTLLLTIRKVDWLYDLLLNDRLKFLEKYSQ